jgi:hypothetical protein
MAYLIDEDAVAIILLHEEAAGRAQVRTDGW